MAKVGARGRGSNTATSSSAVFAPMISLPRGGNAVGVASAVMGYTAVAFVRLGEVYQRALFGLVFFSPRVSQISQLNLRDLRSGSARLAMRNLASLASSVGTLSLEIEHQ